MAVTLVTTPGSISANSYATLAEASSYFEATDWSPTWEALSTQEKSKALVRATRDLEALYVFSGSKEAETQALEFPRSAELPGHLYDSGIPRRIKHAQLELARWTVSDAVAGTSPSERGIDEVDVHGVVSVVYSKSMPSSSAIARDGGNQQRVDALVRPFLSASGGPNTFEFDKF